MILLIFKEIIKYQAIYTLKKKKIPSYNIYYNEILYEGFYFFIIH